VQWRPAVVLLAWVMLSLALVGCGAPSKVKVTGTIRKNGQPLTVSAKTLVTVSFASAEEKNPQTYPAKFTQATGAYELELPPGKYKANVVVVEPGPPGQPGRPFSMPPESTKTVYDLTQAKDGVDIEIGKR
jgi:hypothetical protein